MTENKTVSCPSCRKPVECAPTQRWRPFCSERCKLMDLGDWLDESNRITGESPEFPPAPDTGGARNSR